MKIITIPHPTLRKKAQSIEPQKIELKVLKRFIEELEKTLAATNNPKGVGLAAPQVDKPFRIFTTALDDKRLTLINPSIEKHSDVLTLGPDPNEPILEGCLSMPNLWGAVPRFEWVELSFQTIDEQSTDTLKLISHIKRFENFPARVVQHELDHLDGILFIDHSLRYDLPVYQDNKKNKKAEEVERSFLELI